MFSPEIAFDEDTVIEVDMPDRLSDLSNCVATSDQMGGNAAECNRDSIRFENAFSGSTTAGAAFTLKVGTGTNGESVRDQGTLTIKAYLEIDDVEYTVAEYSGVSTFVPTAGSINSASVTPASFVTYAANTLYTFSLNPKHKVETGFVQVTFPNSDFIIKDSSVNYDCKFKTEVPRSCAIDDESVRLELDSDMEITASTANAFSFEGIRNPRTTEPVSGFTFTTYDADGYVIDTGTSSTSLTMTTLAEADHFQAEYVNATNGAVTSILFSL